MGRQVFFGESPMKKTPSHCSGNWSCPRTWPIPFTNHVGLKENYITGAKSINSETWGLIQKWRWVNPTFRSMSKSYISFYDSSYSSYPRSLAPRVAGRSPEILASLRISQRWHTRGGISLNIPWVSHEYPMNIPWHIPKKHHYNIVGQIPTRSTISSQYYHSIIMYYPHWKHIADYSSIQLP